MDETPRLSSLTDGVQFEQSPDPLLRLPNTLGPNLYAPGHLDVFTRGRRSRAQEVLRQKRAAALRAHPSAGAGLPAGGTDWEAAPFSQDGLLSKNRWLAVILALLFGTLGAHNFYLGKHNRAVNNVLIWFACSLVASMTSSIFAMLPILALVMVECVQIVRRTGAYADLA